MAILEIEGQRIEVDDVFFEMPPEQQAKEVDEIGKILGIQPSQPPETQEPDLGSRTRERFGGILPEFVEDIQEIQGAQERGEQSLPETGLQIAGQSADAVLDTLGAGIATGVDAGVTGVQTLAPETSAQIEAKLTELGNSDSAQTVLDLLKGGAENAVSAFRTLPENVQRDIGAVFNIGALALPPGTSNAGKLTNATGIAGRTAPKLQRAAMGQQFDRRADFLNDLVLPKQTAKVRESQVGRTQEGGLLSKEQITPSAAEKAIADEVGNVPGVVDSNTLRQNFQAVDTAIRDESKSLDSLLRSQRGSQKIPPKARADEFAKVRAALDDEPLIVGDAAKTANKVLNVAERFIKQQPSTPLGILQARRKFDNWIKRQKPQLFDSPIANAQTLAVREVRDAMNNLVANHSPQVGVRRSLQKQSNLFRALDRLGPKAADEAGSAIARLQQRITNAVGLKQTIAGGAGAVTGALALPSAASALILQGIGVGALFYGGGKVLASPKTKLAVSRLLRRAEGAIKKTKDPDTIRQLRADRAAVLEVFKQIETRANVDEAREQQATAP